MPDADFKIQSKKIAVDGEETTQKKLHIRIASDLLFLQMHVKLYFKNIVSMC